MKMNIKTILMLAVLLPASALSGVNPKNGDFFITYRDISQQRNEQEFNLTRTYNSLSQESGWFGYGWGSPFETRLIVMPDGTAAIQENGTGEINFYRPKGNVDIQSGLRRIMEYALKRESLTPEAAEALKQSLARDEELRVRKVRQHDVKSELPSDAELASHQCAAAKLVRAAEGFKRTTCDHDSDFFDLQGRLVRSEQAAGYGIRINYDGAHPTRISDSLGQSIDLLWNAAGLIGEAKAEGKEHVIYSYSTSNDLVTANTVNGLRYDYQYDGYHNMTRIGYIDDSSMLIEYVPPATGIVRSVTERNGNKTAYEYSTDPDNPLHTWTKVTAISPAGRQASREYEYQLQRTETGEEKVARLATNSDENRRESSFDGKGRVVRKTNSGGDIAEYVYHPVTDKLILILDKEGKPEFHYEGRP